MAYLVTFHWGWLSGALLLGSRWAGSRWCIAAQACRERRPAGCGLPVAGWWPPRSHVVPGRPGYWLELGLILFVPYLAGCAVGSVLRAWVVWRSMATRSG